METFEYTFQYESDIIENEKRPGETTKVAVTVEYIIYNAHNYDTPHGPSPSHLAVGASTITNVTSEDTKIDLDQLRLDHDDFMYELINEVTLHEDELVEFARKQL